MDIYIKSTHQIKRLSLKAWDASNSQWSPDLLADMEPSFPLSHGTLPGDNALICTEDEAKDLIAYWDNYNDGTNTEYVLDIQDIETLTEEEVQEEIKTTNFRGLLKMLGISQVECAKRFAIPLRTIQNWCTMGPSGRECTIYIRLMMAECMGLIGPTRIE